MVLPSNLVYGHVVGRYLLAVGDSSDGDMLPDGVPAQGTVVFTPSVSRILDIAALPPTTVLPQPVTCTFDQTTGDLRDPAGNLGVYLVATDSDIYPAEWTYKVKITIPGSSTPIIFDIEVPGLEEVDLTTVTPVPSSNGIFYPEATLAASQAQASAVSASTSATVASASASSASDSAVLAENARADAEAAQAAAEAVPTTTDALIAGRIADTASATRAAVR